MKAHTVKSNAKRAARKFCEAHPGFEAAAPQHLERGKLWVPVLNVVGEPTAEAIEAAKKLAIVAGLPEPKAEKPKAKTGPKRSRKLPADVVAKAVKALPPPVQSTADEIAARREARRQRGAKPAPAKALNKSETIVSMVSRASGATPAELQEATGWQAHTLRGYIAGTLRKRGFNIVLERLPDGNRYCIPAA